MSVYEISRYTTRQLLPSSKAVGLKRLQARIAVENRFRSCSFTGKAALSLNSLRDIPSRRAKEIRLAGRGGAPEPVNHKNTRDYKGADDYQRGSAEDVSPGCTLSLVHVFSCNQNWIPGFKWILPLPLLMSYAICWILKYTVVYTKVSLWLSITIMNIIINIIINNK